MYHKTFQFLTQKRNSDKLQFELEHGLSYDSIDKNGETLLCSAIGNENYELMKYLLDGRCSPNRTKGSDEAPIERAALVSNCTAIQILLDDPNFVIAPDERPLHCASMYGPLKAVKMLVDYGFSPTQTDDWQRMPIHWAIQEHHPSIVTYLLGKMTAEEVALADNAENLSRLAIGEYSARNKDSVECIKIVLTNPKSKMSVNKNNGLTLAICIKKLPLVRLCVELGANVNLPDDDGLTPLFVAKLRRQKNIADYLISQGAKTDFVSPKGISIADLDNEDIRRKTFIEWYFPPEEWDCPDCLD